MFLKGKLVYLRAMEPDDINWLYHLENDISIWKVSQTTMPYSKYTLEQFILDAQRDISESHQARYMICENENKQLVGAIDLFDYNALHRRVGLGITIKETARQKGYASEAIQLLEIYVKDYLMLNQIYVNIQMDNKKSLLLFQKSGYKQTGVKESWIFDGEDWQDVAFMQKFISK